MARSIGGACIVCLLLAGCAPIESEVDYVSPSPDGVTESATFPIEVGFDHAMDPATINSATFRVTGDQSGSHDGTFIFLGGESIVEFTSTTPYTEGETVTVTLTDGMKSRSNKRLDEYSWTFQVNLPPVIDPSPFHVVSLNPAIEAVDGLPTGTIEIGLASPFNPFTVGDGTILVEGSRSGQRGVSFADLFTSGSALRVNVDRGLVAGERVTVAATDLLRSLEGANAPPSVVQYTVRNAGSLWPISNLDAGAGLVGGSVHFLDPDSDGYEEWAVVAADGTVLLQDVDGSGLTQLFTWSVGENLAGAAVGDFDGDGRTDLAALAATGDRLHVWYGSMSLALTLDDPVQVALDRNATGLVAAHVDPDGVTDLILYDGTGAAAAWGDASSPLSLQLTLPAVAPIGAPVVGDLDGDALPDVVVPITGGDLAVLRALDVRSHELSVTLTPTVPATGVVLVSLDGDDLIDLVATAPAGETPTAFLPNGAMDFDALTLFADTAGPGAIAADWDGDGESDLLSPVVGSTGVRVALGVGDGNLQAPVIETSSAEIAWLALGDANDDGVLDLARVHTDGSWEVSPGDAANPPLADRVSVADFSANAGDTGVSYTVSADHEVTIEGYTLVLSYDPAVLTLESIGTLGTDAGTLGAEFEIPNIDNAAGVAILAVILDFLPPFDGQTLSPGTGDTVATGTLAIAATATGSTPLAPTDGLGSPPTDNSFVSGGLSFAPDLVAGTVTIGSGPPPSADPPFIRGDANRDDRVDVSDGTTIQNWIAGNTSAPLCLDAADANDDGRVDIGDAVYLFDFLFAGGPTPPSPYPLAGSDPTTDLIDCAQ